MNKLYALLVLLLAFTPVRAQRGIPVPVHNRVTINYQDYIVYAEVMTSKQPVSPSEKSYYYWFKSNDIKRTRGDYEGKLLHGAYTEFYPNKNLRAKGQMKRGVKVGQWRSWHPNGEFKEIVRWKKHGRVGRYRMFDEAGDLVSTGKYRDEKLDGVIRIYRGGELVEKQKFNDGVRVVKREKRAKTKRKERRAEKKAKKAAAKAEKSTGNPPEGEARAGRKKKAAPDEAAPAVRKNSRPQNDDNVQPDVKQKKRAEKQPEKQTAPEAAARRKQRGQPATEPQNQPEPAGKKETKKRNKKETSPN